MIPKASGYDRRKANAKRLLPLPHGNLDKNRIRYKFPALFVTTGDKTGHLACHGLFAESKPCCKLLRRRQGIVVMRDARMTAELAARASVRIPHLTEAMENLVVEYEVSTLAEFHAWFYSANTILPRVTGNI